MNLLYRAEYLVEYDSPRVDGLSRKRRSKAVAMRSPKGWTRLDLLEKRENTQTSGDELPGLGYGMSSEGRERTEKLSPGNYLEEGQGRTYRVVQWASGLWLELLVEGITTASSLPVAST